MAKRAIGNRKVSAVKQATTNLQGNKPDWRQWIDTLSKGTFFVLASIYVVGFLVITIAYTKIGAPAPTNPIKYLAAGLTPLVILFAAWYLIKKARSAETSKKQLFTNFNLFLRCCSFLFTLTMGVLIVGGSIIGLPETGKPLFDLRSIFKGNTYHLSTTITLGLFGLLFAFGALEYFLHNPYLENLFSRLQGYTVTLWILIVVFIIAPSYQLVALWLILTMFIFYLLGPLWELKPRLSEFNTIWKIIWPSFVSVLLYGAFLYLSILPLFGGGAPSYIVIRTKDHPLYHNNSDSSLNLEAKLIDKSNNEYTMLVEDSLGLDRTVELSANQIECVIYLTPKEVKARQAKANSLARVKATQAKEVTEPPAPPPSSPSAKGGGK